MLKKQLRRLISACLALCTLCGVIPLSASAVDIDAPADGNFSFLWVSDPQIYTNEYQHILSAQNDWIVENANLLNVKYAFHTGDLVHVYTDTSQWEFVDAEYQKWDDAGFAYGVLAGNHDMSGTDYSLYSQYFGASRYNNTETNWWYGGDYKDNFGHYDLRSTGGADFVFVYLSYATAYTAEDYAWVNSVLSQYSDRIAILSFHEYLATSGERSALGEDIFQNVVLKNPNVRMVLCGHNYNSARVVDEIDDNGDGAADRTVYQLMANYQYTTNGGNGFLRLMECDVTNGIITHRTYSPYTASFGSDYEDGTILDEFGYRDEFITPFDFSDPTPKAAGDPAVGTVVASSQMSFCMTDTTSAVTLPVAYQNEAESGATYQGVGVYDRYFSLDAADAFSNPAALNYVVTEYNGSTGHTVTKVIKGSTLGSSDPQVPIPQNGAVVVLPANAAIDLNTITVGRKVMLNKMTRLTTPSAIRAMNITVPSWGGVYNIDAANRLTGDNEWVVYDALSTASYTHEWDMLFAFTPVSGTTYRLSAASTTLGEAKTLSVPTNGFVLSANMCSAKPELIASMRALFKSGLQVTVNGYQPGKAFAYESTSILAPSAASWTCDSTIVVSQSGSAQVFYNTDSQYPDATYRYSTPITIDPAAQVLHYDYLLESNARTSIVLFFKGSSGEQSITIQSHFEGQTVSDKSGDAKGDGVRRSGNIDLTKVEIPVECYNADGTLTLNGIRIFASGTANKKLYIYTLAATTDMNAGKELVISQTLPLLDSNIAVTTASKTGSYVYDNGTLSITSSDASGYEVVVTLNKSFDVSTLKNWLVDVDATVPFDIQLVMTTSSGDGTYGLESDFWPADSNFIPAGRYQDALNLYSCFTYNGVLPANGITTVKQVKILLGGAGTLNINTLQVSNGTKAGIFADGEYKTMTTPTVNIDSDVYDITDANISGVEEKTTVSALLANITGGTLTVKENGAAVSGDALLKTGMTAHTADGATYTIVVVGDVDSDGNATTTDARCILKAVLGTHTLTAAQRLAADLDGSNELNTTDVRKLLRSIATEL